MLSKQRIAAALKRAPFLLSITHRVWRLTRPHFTAGVVGVVFDDDARVLLVEHVYHVFPHWGLPGGYVDRGETLETAVVRELREELALDTHVISVALVGHAVQRHLDIAYWCQAKSNVGAISAELLAYAWFPLDALPPVRPFHARAIHAAAALMLTSHRFNV